MPTERRTGPAAGTWVPWPAPNSKGGQACRDNGPRKLRRPVRQSVAPGETARDGEAQCDGGVEMRGADMAQRIDHRQNDKPAYPGRRHEARVAPVEMSCSRQGDRREDDPEGADKLRQITARHGVCDHCD